MTQHRRVGAPKGLNLAHNFTRIKVDLRLWPALLAFIRPKKSTTKRRLPEGTPCIPDEEESRHHATHEREPLEENISRLTLFVNFRENDW